MPSSLFKHLSHSSEKTALLFKHFFPKTSNPPITILSPQTTVSRKVFTCSREERYAVFENNRFPTFTKGFSYNPFHNHLRNKGSFSSQSPKSIYNNFFWTISSKPRTFMRVRSYKTKLFRIENSNKNFQELHSNLHETLFHIDFETTGRIAGA